MKTKNVVIGIVIAPVVVVVTFIIFILLYAWGPVFLLRLTPYEEIQRRTAFPQWISNDEICYVELVLHRDKTVFEQGKFILFIKNPITDIYIYREKAGRPETKKLIKHIARRHIQPSQSLEGSLDMNLGFRVYDNGKKLFLYYNYYGGIPSDYRYITLDIDGKNMKERTPEIIPLDISQDGKKLYGVRYDDLDEDNENYILEYSIRDGKVKRLIEVTEDKVEQSRRANIKDLKLLSEDKLVLSYHTDSIVPDSGDYIYLVDVSHDAVGLVGKIPLLYYDSAPDYLMRGNYVIEPNFGYVFSLDGKYLIAGNVGVSERKEKGWVKIKDFYKEYPSVSPDGKRIVFIDLLSGKGEIGLPSFAGRKLTIASFEDLLRDEGTTKVK